MVDETPAVTPDDDSTAQDDAVVEPAPEVEPAPPARPVLHMPEVKQPREPVGLPTGNPWDLAYPLGTAPPPVRHEGGAAPSDGRPGFVGEQVDPNPNTAYTLSGVTAPASEES